PLSSFDYPSWAEDPPAYTLDNALSRFAALQFAVSEGAEVIDPARSGTFYLDDIELVRSSTPSVDTSRYKAFSTYVPKSSAAFDVSWEKRSSSAKSSSSQTVSSSIQTSGSSSIQTLCSSSSNASSSSVVSVSSSSFDWDVCVSAGSCGTFTDERDGQSYKFVTIGDQIWMAQNLNYSGDSVDGARTYTKGWCYGVGGQDTTDHSDSSTCDTYGRSYNWTDAMDIDESYLATTWGSSDTVNHQGICPEGWHVPTSKEWLTLTNYLGSDSAGYILKSSSGWLNDGNGSDAAGFSALYSGYRQTDNAWTISTHSYFWSVKESSSTFTRIRYLFYSSTILGVSNQYKFQGFSLRCLENQD
ncbi:MAG TPA: FISUMP domain-containing protein, partial [Fibrobacteraceae bacterium]|nr:FISUMP domain-containing protein [Fibrobacteraceae bacterium]